MWMTADHLTEELNRGILNGTSLTRTQTTLKQTQVKMMQARWKTGQ